MENYEQLISDFYRAFAQMDHQAMAACYHEDVIFSDPAFGELRSNRAAAMWQMLLSNEDTQLKVSADNIEADANQGSADWTASYLYGPDQRQVVNHVHARFQLRDGTIIRHEDLLSLWRCSRQALGLTGLFLGWTPMLRNKVQKMTNSRLDKFVERQV